MNMKFVKACARGFWRKTAWERAILSEYRKYWQNIVCDVIIPVLYHFDEIENNNGLALRFLEKIHLFWKEFYNVCILSYNFNA